MVGFQRRYDPSIRRAKDLIEDGSIGDLEQVVIVARDPAPPPAEYVAVSGGIFKDMTIHDFDEARFFLGEIVEVSAFGQKVLPELAEVDDFDAAVVMLRGADGAVATVMNNRRCVTGYDQRLEVHGSAGSAVMDNLRPTALSVNTAEASGTCTITSPAVCAGPTSSSCTRWAPTSRLAWPENVLVGGRCRTPAKSKGAKMSAK